MSISFFHQLKRICKTHCVYLHISNSHHISAAYSNSISKSISIPTLRSSILTSIILAHEMGHIFRNDLFEYINKWPGSRFEREIQAWDISIDLLQTIKPQVVPLAQKMARAAMLYSLCSMVKNSGHSWTEKTYVTDIRHIIDSSYPRCKLSTRKVYDLAR